MRVEIVAFTFHEGGSWVLLPASVKGRWVAEGGNNYLAFDVPRSKPLIPAAVILGDGRLYDNILASYDFSKLAKDMSSRKQLLLSVRALRKRLLDEYPSTR